MIESIVFFFTVLIGLAGGIFALLSIFKKF